MLAVESGVSGLLLEELRERGFNVLQRLLEADAGAFVEPDRILLGLQFRQFFTQTCKTIAFLGQCVLLRLGRYAPIV